MAGPRLLRLRDLERLPHRLGDHAGDLQARVPLGDGPEHVHDVDVLVRLLVDPVPARLAGDGHHRRPIEVRVAEAGGEVGRAGAERAETDAGAAAEASPHVGHERRALLVTAGHELDAGVEERVEEGERLLARHAEEDPDVLVPETTDQQLGAFHRLAAGALGLTPASPRPPAPAWAGVRRRGRRPCPPRRAESAAPPSMSGLTSPAWAGGLRRR